MDEAGFRASVAAGEPPGDAPPALLALFHAWRGAWELAHEVVQGDEGSDAAWVHAHLHRVEGDLANARYWYQRAGRAESHSSFEDERASIARALLGAAERG